MIPGFTSDGLLPAGIHAATWGEVVARFGGNMRRDGIIHGLRQALNALSRAGCKQVWVNGSFVTSKANPSDWDGCWDPRGVNPTLLDPVFLDFGPIGRARMKMKYLADVFPASLTEASSRLTFVEFFQIEKTSGAPKGILLLDLTGWTP